LKQRRSANSQRNNETDSKMLGVFLQRTRMSIFDEGYNQAVLGITRQPVVRPPAGMHGRELMAKRIKTPIIIEAHQA